MFAVTLWMVVLELLLLFQFTLEVKRCIQCTHACTYTHTRACTHTVSKGLAGGEGLWLRKSTH